MEKPLEIASWSTNIFGNRMTIVYVSGWRIGCGEYVTVSTAEGGSGSAMGVWEKGFVATDLATESERLYFCSVFGLSEEKISHREFVAVNKLYVRTRQDLIQRIKNHHVKKTTRTGDGWE